MSAADSHKERRGVCLAEVSFVFWLAVGVQIVPLGGAVGLPDGPAGLLVERNEVLDVHAIHGQDEQVLEQEEGRARAAIVPTGQIGSFPQHFAGLRVQRCRPIAPEVHVHAAGFDNRRRRSIAVEWIAKGFGMVGVKQLLLEAYPAGVSIDANNEEVVTVESRCRQPHLPIHHDRSGPAPVGDGCLPSDVFLLAPMDRHAQWFRARDCGKAITPGSPKLGPLGLSP